MICEVCGANPCGYIGAAPAGVVPDSQLDKVGRYDSVVAEVTKDVRLGVERSWLSSELLHRLVGAFAKGGAR